jgi:hypothetical protein
MPASCGGGNAMFAVLASDPSPLAIIFLYMPLIGTAVSIVCTTIVAKFGQGRWWSLLLLEPSTAFGVWFLFMFGQDLFSLGMMLAVLGVLPLIVILVGWFAWLRGFGF